MFRAHNSMNVLTTLIAGCAVTLLATSAHAVLVGATPYVNQLTAADQIGVISSFYPRGFASRSLAVESRFGSRTIADLQRRGHDVSVWPAWSAGRVSAVAREPDGLLRAGANPRGMQGYAVGR